MFTDSTVSEQAAVDTPVVSGKVLTMVRF